MAAGSQTIPPVRATPTLADHLRQRFLAGILITLLTTGAALVTGWLAYRQAEQAYAAALAQTATIQALVAQLNNAAVSEVLFTRAYLITGDPQSIVSRELSQQDFERIAAELQKKLGDSPAIAVFNLNTLLTLHGDYAGLARQMIALRGAGQSAAAVQLFNEHSDPLVPQLLAAGQDLVADIHAGELAADRAYSAHAQQIILQIALVFLGGVLLSSWLIIRQLSTPLAALKYFELALAETAHKGALNAAPLPEALPKPDSPIFHAYNTLVTRLQENETSRLNFLSRVAHNLRSPLASITGYAGLMSNATLRPPDANLEEYARIIARQAARLEQMIEQMVLAAEIDENRLDLTFAPVRVGVLVAEAVAEARQRSGREIGLEDNLGPVIVACDALRMQAVIASLLDNALKFSPPDTPVAVSLRRSATPNQIEIAVADHGIGIAEADLPILFTRFGRLANQTARSNSGNGLGLYIVKYLVEHHQGRVTVRSQLGQGATFTVILPLNLASPKTGAANRAKVTGE